MGIENYALNETTIFEIGGNQNQVQLKTTGELLQTSKIHRQD